MMKVDYIIIGQGLAGTVLAYLLLKRGKTICIIDDGHKSSASMVAAGMWNPMVFKRMNKAWRADELLPVAEKIYRQMEVDLGVKCYFKKDILRVFPNHEIANDFDLKSEAAGFEKYVSTEVPPLPPGLLAPFGCGRVKESGYLDLPVLLNAFRAFVKAQGALLEASFDETQIAFETDGLRYGDIAASGLIYCNGHQMVHSSYFNFLPLLENKGEVLTVRIPDLKSDYTLNNGKFLLPIGADAYRLGATYQWDTSDLSLSSTAREELLSKLSEMLNCQYEVLVHKAGIRPTVSDRRPLLGGHPEHAQLFVFNGLGTRGVMIAPAMASHFTDYLSGLKPLDREVDIARFQKKARQRKRAGKP